jgi:hypothetical protein
MKQAETQIYFTVQNVFCCVQKIFKDIRRISGKETLSRNNEYLMPGIGFLELNLTKKIPQNVK